MTDISAVKQRVSLPSLVSRHTRLARSNGVLKGHCPFHDEKSPSFCVYDDHYHCFGCGAHGDVLDFVMGTQRVGFVEALNLLGSDKMKSLPSPQPQQLSVKKADWIPLPIPAGSQHPDLSKFDHVYVYRDERGNILRYICRMDARGETKKRIIPLTYGALLGRVGWHKKHSDDRRLYNLNHLAVRPQATVILCEGEKAADAASVLFSNRVAATWSGGSSAINKADFTSLWGRRVILWPDNDEPGRKAMAAISKTLSILGAKTKTLNVIDLDPGDDAADINPESPEAWLAAHLAS